MLYRCAGRRAAIRRLRNPLQPFALRPSRFRWRPGDLRRHEKRVYSQSGEDGIIQEIFRRIGEDTRFFVEFGAGDGVQCNSAWFAIEKQWHGLLIDMGEQNYSVMRGVYRDLAGVTCLNTSVSSANIEQILAANAVPKQFDLLSIDIDGNDYWVWAAIRRWRPRVVAIEYNANFPPPARWVMKENPNHRWDGTDYFGASLSSLAALGQEKGYALVGTNTLGVNAFFVRRDTAGDGMFVDADPEYHYSPPRYGKRGRGSHAAGDRPFVEI
jgi:hypothetical protein